jgi:phosphopantetheinyl transferase
LNVRIFSLAESVAGDESIAAIEIVTGAISKSLQTDHAVVVSCHTRRSVVASRATLRLLDRALRPVVARLDPYVSRSATDGAIAWAACTTRPIGVDVQSPPNAIDNDLIAATLCSNERDWLSRQLDKKCAFAQLWAGKEAVLKAFGVGLAWPPNQIDVTPDARAWQRLVLAALGSANLSFLDAGHERGTWLAVALNMGHDTAVDCR